MNLTTSWIGGKEAKDTEQYLNLYKFSTLLMRKLAHGKIKADELWRISVPDTEEHLSDKVSEILTDQNYADQYYKAPTVTEKNRLLEFACRIVQQNWWAATNRFEEKKDVQDMKYGYREVRYSKMSPLLKDPNTKFTTAYFRNNPIHGTNSRKKFDADLHTSLTKTADKETFSRPAKFLREIESKLDTMKDGLEEKSGGRKAALILKDEDGIGRIDDCVLVFGKIKKIIKQKGQKTRNQQKKKKKKKKKKSKKKRRR